MKTERSAYVLRISPSGIDRVDDALAQDQIIIGWSAAQDLLDPKLEWSQFREIIHRAHYDGAETYRRSGGAAGQMWRFIHEMAIGDYVVVPHGASFHVAEITGPATYQKDLVDDDTAYRRVVTWLNSKQPIPRRFARAALISRMKYQGTCVEATEILRDIDDVLEVAA